MVRNIHIGEEYTRSLLEADTSMSSWLDMDIARYDGQLI